jgi:tetratricopeptide (TPR) repeat protein
MSDTPGSSERAPDLVLARLHLRLGSLSLARAELETLAGKDMLDADGVVDLAEARWRTGDITGAGEAAALVLDDDEGPVLALIVAAEAAAERGRPTEARRLAAKALSIADGSIDALFAGMPRSPAWPPDPAAPPPSPTTMFDAPTAGRAATGRASSPEPRPSSPEPARAAAEAGDAAAVGAGLWDEDLAAAAEAEAESQAAIDASLPTGEEALDAGRAALAAGDVTGAALRFSIVLRIAPALAPAVIDLVGERHDPRLALVRGDAYRLVGRELDARRAYVDAAGPEELAPPHVPDPQSDPPSDPVSEGDPE